MSSRLQHEASIVGAPRWIVLSQVPAAILTPGWAISGRQVTYRPLTWEGDLPATPLLARLTPGPVSIAVSSYVASATLSESVAISVEEYDLLRRIPGPILPHRPNGVMGENGGTINAWSLAKQFVPLSRGTIPGDAWAPRRWWREYGDAARAYAREHHLRGPRLDEVAVAVAPASTVARYIQGRNDNAAWNMAHAAEMERIRPLLSRLLSLGAIVADGMGEMRRLVVVW